MARVKPHFQNRDYPAKRVLIVDDSRAIRTWLRTVLNADPRLQIVGEAGNAIEARDFLRRQAADVVTLDVEMPGMSGLEFLTRLMRARPMPVVMLSSLTAQGSDTVVQALSRGAVDCILKPTDGFDPSLNRDICERVFQAASSKPSRRLAGLQVEAPQATSQRFGIGQPCRRGALILVGASTGGVAALENLLPQFDADGPPVVIVQHMPGNFLRSFSERLNRHLQQNVRLAVEGQILKRGDVVLAPGIGKHTEVIRRAEGWSCRFVEDKTNSLHCPSVDRLFFSALPEAKHVAAVILTGLGKDGAEGMLCLAQAGAATFGQDEDTCVVYGMPRAAFSLGAVKHQLAIENIGAAVNRHIRSSHNRVPARSHNP